MENNIIVASEGKVFRRKADGFIVGNKIYLGYAFVIGGKKLAVPKLETREDFEEIDEPTEWAERRQGGKE